MQMMVYLIVQDHLQAYMQVVQVYSKDRQVYLAMHRCANHL